MGELEPEASPEVVRALDEIASAVRGQRAEFLFGAGMSVASGIPSGRALGKILVEHFFRGRRLPDDELTRVAGEFPLELLASAVEVTSGLKEQELTRQLTDALAGAAPNQGHRDFATIVGAAGMVSGHASSGGDDGTQVVADSARVGISRVFTTNYDRLLESALGEQSISIWSGNAKEIRRYQANKQLPVVHLHGIVEPPSYDISEEDLYDSRYKPLHAEFRSALTQADAFVFVGYSLSDGDLRALYLADREEIAYRRQADRGTYVVSPIDGMTFEIAQAIWRSRGAVLIPMTGEQFMACLKREIQSKINDQMYAEVKKRYKLSDGALRGQLAKLQDTFGLEEEQEALQLLFEEEPHQ